MPNLPLISHHYFKSPSISSFGGVSRKHSRRRWSENGSRRSSQSVRRALLLHVRFQPCRPWKSVPGRLHAYVRRPEDPGLPEHRRQAHLSPFPAMPARDHYRRLPALWSRRRHARLRLRYPTTRRRTARPQVQPGR